MGARAYNLVVPMGQSDGLYPGIAALYNDQRGSVVQVRRVELLPPGGQSALGLAQLELQRFFTTYPSDLSDAQVVPAVKLDTNSPDPPLVCWTCPFFGSPLTVESINRAADFPAGSQTVALAPMSARQTLGGERNGLRNSAMLSGRALTSVEPVRLMLGGHALCLVQTAAGHPHAGRVEVVVRNTSTGATYLYTVRVNTGVPDPLRPLFALWAPSDSWDIKRFDWITDTQATPLAGLRLVKVEEDHLTDIGRLGDPIVPSAHDSAFPCPGSIRGVSGVLRGVPFGRSTGVPYDYDTTHGAHGWTVVSQLQAGRMRRVVRPTAGINVGSVLSPMMMGTQLIFDGSRAPIIVQYEQALMLCDGVGADLLPSAYAAGEANIEFTVTDNVLQQSVFYVS